MDDFFDMLPVLLRNISTFLASDPIKYFVGIMLVAFVAGLVKYIMFGRERY